MKLWEKKNQEQIKARIFGALDKNVNYFEQNILGIPASHLDSKVFYQDAPFLKEAPFISTLVHNPNHIGCHTLGKSEHFFGGTQEIEREVIEICASEILGGNFGEQDGYVASGGTEANMQAIWVYRNYFMRKHNAKPSEICVLCSADSHYSMDKAANVLGVEKISVAVNPDDRTIEAPTVAAAIESARSNGKRYFIVVANMMTTMFGSVDNVNIYIDLLDQQSCEYRIHVDGAYGGFYYPFTDQTTNLNFSNPKITSVTLDAHKMVQAPYGTGIFLIRKGWIQHANTKSASYVEGEDFTLIGSRSGANAVAIWMILMKNGPFGWQEKIFILQKRTDWLCENLDRLNIGYYRHPMSNIVTIKQEFVPRKTADAFGLVPDNHANPNWFKVVIMEHVTIEKLIPLIDQLSEKQ